MGESAQASKVQPYSAGDFEVGWRRRVGRGAFSTVWNLKKVKDGDILTLKLYKSEAKDMVNASRARELKVLSMIDFRQCPFIVELKGIYMGEGVVVGLLFESAELGNWSEFLDKYAPLLLQRRLHMFELKLFHAHCISQALKYLRSLGVVHGDLALANVLLFRSGLRAKLCDFGAARLDGGAEDSAIPVALRARRAYVAPETAVNGARSSFATDVYGFGVLLTEAFYGDLDALWEAHPKDPQPEQWEHFLSQIRECLTQVFPLDEISDQCNGLIEVVMSCIALRPDDRSDIANVESHLSHLISQMEPRLKERKATLKKIMNQELVTRSDSLPLSLSTPDLTPPTLGLPSPRTVRRLPSCLPSLEPTATSISLLLPSPGATSKPFVVTYDVATFESGDNNVNSPSTPFVPFRNVPRQAEPPMDISGLHNPEGKPTQSMIRAVMHMTDLQRNLRSVLLTLRLTMVDLDNVDNYRQTLGDAADEPSIVYFALDQVWLERHYRQATRGQLVDALVKSGCRESAGLLLNLPDDLD